MTKENTQATKLTAVYESLTASIRLMAESYPEALDYVAMPMADLENLVNEANGHKTDHLYSISKSTKAH